MPNAVEKLMPQFEPHYALWFNAYSFVNAHGGWMEGAFSELDPIDVQVGVCVLFCHSLNDCKPPSNTFGAENSIAKILCIARVPSLFLGLATLDARPEWARAQ